MFRLTSIVCLSLFVFGNTGTAQSIQPAEGFTPQIGYTVAMLEDLKLRVTRSVAELSHRETDFLLDEESNTVGAMILHLAATERFYQIYTFEERQWTEEEQKDWIIAQNLGEVAREQLKGQPMSYYLGRWDEVRAETLRLLKTKDDEWFAAKHKLIDMNNHWAWYHVMEHQANHMGQIRYIIKRM